MSAWKIQTKVQPGGKIEVTAPDLPVGQAVEVTILSLESPPPKRPAREILASAPGCRLFQTAAEIEAYLRAERDAWER